MANLIKMQKSLFLTLIGLIVFSLIAAADVFENLDTQDYLPVWINEVKVNDQLVFPWDATKIAFERGQELEVRVSLVTYEDVKNLEVKAFLTGNEFDSIYASSGVFDALANTVYVKKLKLNIDTSVVVDRYSLRVIVADRAGDLLYQNYNLLIDAPRHELKIKDISLTPSSQVKAGKSLIVKVRVENFGQKTEKDVRVVVSVPELGIETFSYIDKIESDPESQEEETEEMVLQIPSSAKAGTYDLEVTAEYAKGRKTTSAKTEITVLEDEKKKEEPKLSVVSGATTLKVKTGESAIWPITVHNPTKTRKSVALAVAGGEGLSIDVKPSASIVLDSGKTTTFFVHVKATESAKTSILTATVSSGNEILDQLNFALNVEEPTKPALKTRNVLEIVLIALIILLVVIALIIGVSKLKE